MDLPVINSKSKTSVSEVIFNQSVNKELITQLINSFVSNSHQGTKAQKNRSDVRGGGKKPWRQKGTGRARAGTIRSPIWRGGGVTFAARSKSSEPKKINKKMYKSAMRSIFSSLAENNKIFLSKDISIENPKTKELLELLKKIKFNSERAPQAVGLYPHARKCGNLLFLSGVGPRVAGSKEIPGVSLDENGEIKSYDIEKQCHSVFKNIIFLLHFL